MSHLFVLQDVSKRYGQGKAQELHALRHVNLTIDAGDCFGCIGFSGAGKSTLLRCLATLEDPSLGEILYQGRRMTSFSKTELMAYRKEFGMIFQHFNLFSSRTVIENIMYPMEIMQTPKEERRKNAHELLALVGLNDKAHVYPSQLSGGQKQRVGIARALANGPKFLLCDEATSALDPQTTHEILQLLKKLQTTLGLTIILITHEMEVIKAICNKVAVLDKGEVVERGTLASVFVEPKHPVTKQLVSRSMHEIPKHLLSGKGRVVHLHFKGAQADQPIITQMAKHMKIDVNILLGWIDSLQTVTVGNLIVEITGEEVERAIAHMQANGIIVEEVTV